ISRSGQTTTVNGALAVTQGTTLTGLLTANGGLTDSGAVSITGNTTLNGTSTLTVGSGLTSLGGGLSVTAGATTLSGGLTVTNGGNVAFQKGSDYGTTGPSNNVSLGAAELYRLTGTSTQTITGFNGGVDGRILTLVNAASQAAVIQNLNSGSTAANQI